jgi:nitrite reductase (NADH) small subunit
MIDARWIRITACDNIPAREGRTAVVGDREIAIFNVGDGFLAVDNRCPHRGGPLADGIVAGGAVVCPLHAWKINLQTGSVERPAGGEACVRSYPTRVEGGIVLIELPAAATAGAGPVHAGVEAA